MAGIRKPDPVLLFVAALYSPSFSDRSVLDLIAGRFGRILSSLAPFPFDYSDYYEAEMGKDLRKFFVFVDRLIEPQSLSEWKLLANKIESEFAENGARSINLDPGYLELPKLVLASTKNFTHRIYLGKGIYGDVQLYVKDGRFHSNPWTYPDYKRPEHLEFFMNARREYRRKLSHFSNSE